MSEKLGNAYENKIKKPVTIDIYIMFLLFSAKSMKCMKQARLNYSTN
jgi:hypothetical protein